MLVTLASNGSSTRLYRITTANGTSFSSWAVVPMGLSNNPAIGSPSVEAGADRTASFRYTAYVHTGSNLMYEGSSNPGSSTFSQAFQSIYTTALADGPAAIGGNLGADSSHVVFAKPWGSDQLVMTATTPGVQ